MNAEITIENLQQEVAELKIKNEAQEAEIKRLNDDLNGEKGFHKMWEDSAFDYLTKLTKMTDFVKTIKLMLGATKGKTSEIKTTAQIELMEATIDDMLK